RAVPIDVPLAVLRLELTPRLADQELLVATLGRAPSRSPDLPRVSRSRGRRTSSWWGIRSERWRRQHQSRVSATASVMSGEATGASAAQRVTGDPKGGRKLSSSLGRPHRPSLFQIGTQLRGSSRKSLASSRRNSAKLTVGIVFTRTQPCAKAGRFRLDSIPSRQFRHVGLLMRPFILRKICSFVRSKYR